LKYVTVHDSVKNFNIQKISFERKHLIWNNCLFVEVIVIFTHCFVGNFYMQQWVYTVTTIDWTSR
jgi:hypothetical protein